ncbi:NrfD/PsrC family molybdoenzyme membrane anchor subunit [Chloroflexota bacterium]
MSVKQDNPVINSRFIKPQKEWGWQVALYLYLAGMGSGALALGLLMDWMGNSPYSSRTILLWGPIFVAVGALFLVLKLGVKRRFLNTVLNPRTSWLSRGFYILSVCIIVGGLVMLVSLLPLFGIDINRWSVILLIFDIIAFIFALGTAVYTGILIQSVKYVSFWNTWLLPALFTVSALSTGAIAIVLSTYVYDLIVYSKGYSSHMMHVLMNIEQVLLIIEAIVLVLYLYSRYRAEGQGKSSVLLLLFGNLRYLFWLGIVACCFALPVFLEVYYTVFPDNSFILFAMGASTLIGGLFLRIGVIYAGIKDQTSLHKFIEIQYYLRIPGKGLDMLFDNEFTSEEEHT